MGEEGKSFGAIVVASVAILLGTKYLITAMIVQLSRTPLEIPMLLGSPLLTAVAGVALVLLAGGFVSGIAFARALTIVTFGTVAILAKPWVTPVEPIVIGETVVLASAILYLLLFDPFEGEERTEVDESTSASRIGSTIR